MTTHSVSRIYIGSGEKNAQYTIRCSWIHLIVGESITRGDNYICNAGRDWDRAVEKAKSYAKEYCHRYVESHIFGLNPYSKFTEEELLEYRRYLKRIKGRGTWFSYLAKERQILKEVADTERRKKWREEELRSRYQGKKGERIEREMTVLFNKEICGDYGTSLWVVFADAQGNRYTWKASTPKIYFHKSKYGGETDNWSYELERGVSVKLKGTVKNHSEYKEVQQTNLNRCKYEIVKSTWLEEKKYHQSDIKEGA